MLANLKYRVQQKRSTSFISIAIFNESTSIDAVDLETNEAISRKFRIEIDFELSDDLIYYTSNNVRRLCISRSLEKKVFRLTHDDTHFEVHRCFQLISKTLYISRLLRKLRTYVKHCSSCQVNQTKRHRLYEELMSISISNTSRSFHTMTMNFIVVLSEKYDCLLIITNKFSRRLLLISRYIIDSIAA